MDNRVIDIPPIYVTQRFVDVSMLSWYLYSIPYFASYPQSQLVGIIVRSLGNGLTVYLGLYNPI